MQGHGTDIESSHKYRHIIFICRMHTASLIPGRQKSTTAHGRNNLSVLLIHAGNIAFSSKGKPVRIHGFGRTFHPSLKHILKLLSGTMKIFIIKEYNFREKHRFFTILFPLSLPADIQQGDCSKLCKSACTDSCSYCNKWIISTAAVLNLYSQPWKPCSNSLFTSA